VWNGLRDLSYIIPRNFSNLSQKSGGRSGGATATVNLGKRNDEEEVEGARGEKKKDGQGFVGLKSPDHLKKVCNMFRNSEFKSNPTKYL
jgi:RNA recognition motif-containing protein